MRIVVTGAAGFIGSSLVPALRGRGYEVFSATRETASLAEAFADCEVVVHLANLAHSPANRSLLWRVNVEGSRHTAELAVARRVRRLVYLSSVKAAVPVDDYGRAKLAAERAIAEVAARSSLETVVLRPPLVYGPGVKANFLRLLRAINCGIPLPLASIRNRRSLIYVGNLADAIVRCIESPAAVGQTYSLNDGAPVSTPELCRAIGAALGRPARLFPFPVALLDLAPPLRKLTRSLEVDDGPIRAALGWRPPFTFEEAIRATAEQFRSS